MLYLYILPRLVIRRDQILQFSSVGDTKFGHTYGMSLVGLNASDASHPPLNATSYTQTHTGHGSKDAVREVRRDSSQGGR
ncbi:hypothetical protein K437DRAFT_260371 [Tilletiaria anomala UBC 951]|uniref:Uncharacterized protein n=1 Tax=Tilletiaria anomala (strain ATCC 24038 / CBS 436.72 / UBC 951) TaxID=1037660 RepID=A0A066V9M7_TILAU|nr:uncharacterized protein K437DRAFT_260371 [Tilletiaria anomala UBC 951]KDN35454.1 hypothetical protein K437DRAFT_260371 [Tilletiaria anomala UBC 951]